MVQDHRRQLAGARIVQTFNNADVAARDIIERCHGDIRIALPLGLGKANTIVNALTRAALNDQSIRLEIFTALTLERPGDHAKSELEKRFLEPARDRLFGKYPALLYAELLHREELPKNIEVSEFFLLAGKWKGVERVQQNYISANYTHAYDYLVARKPNVIAQLLARKGTRFSLSCNTDISADLIADREAGKLDFVFAGELNSALPYMQGNAAEIDQDQIQVLLDDPENDFELFSAVKQPVSDAEMAIGLHVSQLFEDGGTIQIGIGSVGDAVAKGLLLRHQDPVKWEQILSTNPFAAMHDNNLAHSGRFETGLYASTEMLVDGLLRLIEGGVLSREVDRAVVHAGFFVETRDFYAALRDMPEERRQKIQMMPVSFTNQLYGGEEKKRAARVKARFVNNAMMVTLLGATVSDATRDGQVISGVGGQYNFVSQAFALKDARSVITVEAVRTGSSMPQSNIVWEYPHTTIPRHLKDIVVTEYGVADLRGKSDADTIEALLAVADSRFQEELADKARNAGKLHSTYELPESVRCNNPETLKQWIAPFREEGTLPQYPFGTDFSNVEQRLVPALAILKEASNSKRKLARLIKRGLFGKPVSDEGECLARMRLDNPAGVKESGLGMLLKGALRSVG